MQSGTNCFLGDTGTGQPQGWGQLLVGLLF